MIRRRVGRIGVTLAVLAGGLILVLNPPGAEGRKARFLKTAGAPVKGISVTASASAAVNFRQLARQQGLSAPAPREPLFKSLPEPRDIEDSVYDFMPAEPPSRAPVDLPGPNLPSPAPANNFAGVDDIPMAPPAAPFFIIPPDTTGAVGTDSTGKVMVTLNNNFRVQDKTTGAAIGGDVAMPTFWSPVGAVDPFDPRVQYDPYNDRWIVAAVSDAGSSTAAILVGVSQTNDPSGSYFLFKVNARVSGDQANLNVADFPMLGFNKNWVVVSINMFNGTTDLFHDGRALVVNYPALRAGTFGAIYYFDLGFCVHPATTYSSTENTEYLVQHLSSASATYRLNTITGTASAPVLSLGATKTRPGGGWTAPGGNILPQAQGTCLSAPTKMESSDAQVRSNVVFRNSAVWYPQTIGLPAGEPIKHTAVQWTQLDTSGNVVQGGRIEDPTATATNGGRWYSYPSIAVNSSNDMVLGFSQFSSTTFASAGYAYRDHVDALGTIRDPVVFKAGQDCYNKDFNSGRNRWGDFSHTMVDPTGDCGLWTIQEYAKFQAPPTVGGSNSKWGTWWAKVNALGCAAPTPTPQGRNFFTLTPCRLLDTRDPDGPLGGPALVAGAVRTFVLAGQCNIPVTARALSINVTVTDPTAGGFLTVYPGGTSLPLASTINYNLGITRANNADVLLGASGDLSVYCGQAGGTVHLVLDVNGYFE
jgi:hypothetical protein